jgi:hypothetical protein
MPRWELPLPHEQPAFQEGVPQYQIHPAMPEGVLPTNLHPPLIYPDPTDQVDDISEGIDRLGRQRHGPTHGNAGNDGSQYAWP